MEATLRDRERRQRDACSTVHRLSGELGPKIRPSESLSSSKVMDLGCSMFKRHAAAGQMFPCFHGIHRIWTEGSLLAVTPLVQNSVKTVIIECVSRSLVGDFSCLCPFFHVDGARTDRSGANDGSG